MSADAIVSSVLAASTGSLGAARVTELGPSGAQPADANEAGRFAAALDRASDTGSITRGGMPVPVDKLLTALDGIDVQARSVADYARTAEASNGELTPGEIVQLTMRCQEFMFQCQLTSNIANRSADGVQQLFRQQG